MITDKMSGLTSKCPVSQKWDRTFSGPNFGLSHHTLVKSTDLSARRLSQVHANLHIFLVERFHFLLGCISGGGAALGRVHVPFGEGPIGRRRVPAVLHCSHGNVAQTVTSKGRRRYLVLNFRLNYAMLTGIQQSLWSRSHGQS